MNGEDEKLWTITTALARQLSPNDIKAGYDQIAVRLSDLEAWIDRYRRRKLYAQAAFGASSFVSGAILGLSLFDLYPSTTTSPMVLGLSFAALGLSSSLTEILQRLPIKWSECRPFNDC